MTTMNNRHVTHLLTRYVNGTLRPHQRAQVVNHVRLCDTCRAALAREEHVAKDLQRELPQAGVPRAGQLAGVWAGVMGEIATSHRRARLDASALFSAASVLVVIGLVMLLALPLLAENDVRVEAAPQQARPVSTASPTPGVTETNEARANQPPGSGAAMQPQATIAFVSEYSGDTAGATPAPVPQVAVSPESLRAGGRW